MVRISIPGGGPITSQQWNILDRIADVYTIAQWIFEYHVNLPYLNCSIVTLCLGISTKPFFRYSALAAAYSAFELSRTILEYTTPFAKFMAISSNF
jgi:hypothetical protein